MMLLLFYFVVVGVIVIPTTKLDTTVHPYARAIAQQPITKYTYT